MALTFFQKVERNLIARILNASDATVNRMTEPRWEVDGQPLDRRAQYMFRVGRIVERSIPTLTPAAARRYYARLNRVLEAPPPEIGSVSELSLTLRSGPRPARAYYPASSENQDRELPALVYFHGGGFTIGSIETHDTLCRRICLGANCVVISVDYRLAPEDRFPAAVEDCDDAYRWVIEHAGELGIRSGRIAVGGDSAGGNLAAVVSFLARDRGGPLPFAQLLIYPGTGTVEHPGRAKAELQTGYGLDAQTTRWFFQNYMGDAVGDDPLAAPLYLGSHVGLPPAIVVTAQFDLLCGEGIEYAEKLRAAGVPVVHQHVPDLPHGFGTMSVIPRAREAIEDFANALEEAFRQSSVAPDATAQK
jgi:acetyl esterase